jgi:histidine kinase
MQFRQKTVAYWICQVVGWFGEAGINLFFLFSSSALTPAQRIRFIAIFSCGAASAIVCTHIYRAYLRRHDWLGLRIWQLIPRMLLASMILGVLITGLVTLEWAVIAGVKTFAPTRVWLPPALAGWTTSALGWNIVYFAVSYYDRYRAAQLEKARLETTAKEAQLQGLVAQINPHFIFNCLNSLRALIVEDPTRARTMVTDLADLLRYTLQSGQRPTVPLQDELQVVNTYLNIERLRFEERLAARIDAAPETLSFPVPSMLVQSLIENGIKHGIEKLPQGGEIHLTTRIKDRTLKVQVVNTGQLMRGGNSTGIGLENARERLRLLYGEQASLTLQQQGANQVVVEISIPAKAGQS